jgi:hypothetical protein
MNIRLKYIDLIQIVITCTIFILSYTILSFYTNGDQASYIRAYDGIENLNLIPAYNYYQGSTGSLELVHFILSWFFSHLGVSKIVFISFANAIFSYFIFSLFRKWKVSLLIGISTIFTNYYLIVLYFSAERLKFAIIFLVLSALYYTGKNRLFYFFALMSHIQIAILFLGILFKEALFNFYKIITKSVISKSFLILIILFVIVLVILQDHIMYKLSYYADSKLFGIENFIKTFIFAIMSVFYSKEKKETFLIFIPLFIAILIFGDTRINILSYFIFLYYGLQVKRGLNMGVILTTLYFGYKSIGFIYNIFTYGDGFH